MKSHTRIIVNILAISMIANLTGCKKNVENDEVFNKIEDDSIVNEEINKNSDLELLLYESLYDESLDYNTVIEQYFKLEDEQRKELKNEYFRALYMKMLNSSISIDKYIQELETINVIGQIPVCLDYDSFKEIFKNLIALDPECLSIVETYGEFAMFIHKLSCEEEHVFNEYGCYSCKKIEDDYKLLLSK